MPGPENEPRYDYRRTFPPGYFERYQSVFGYRYGTDEMSRVWSERSRWLKVRDVWIAGAEVQHVAGLVTREQVDDLIIHRNELSVERILQLERVSGHDVDAAIAEYREVAPIGGEILHQGMTSEEVLSNAEIMQILESFALLKPKLEGVLDGFGERIEQNKNLVCMGYTHLQVAEPTTMGYRFAKYAQDLLNDWRLMTLVVPLIKGKGIKGAVGTSASFVELLKDTRMSPEEHERAIMERLGVDYVSVSDQTYPRKFLFLTENVLSNIGQSLHRFAFDLQILQSSFVWEVSEPRRRGQVGSSAMPHKQNPINAENIDSLTEELPGQSFAAWMTGAFVTLERTLRDSAGKRSWLPESFLIVDEALTRAERIVRGLVIHENAIRTNMNKFAPFCTSEIILTRLIRAGMDRKSAHTLVAEHSERATDAIRDGKSNPFKELLLGDEQIVSLLGSMSIEQAFEDIFHYIGDAPQRCDQFLAEMRRS